MARLTTSQRKKMPASKLGLPQNKGTGKPTFPIPDKGHAMAALMLEKSALKKGSITPAQAKTITRKSDRELKETRKGTTKSRKRK